MHNCPQIDTNGNGFLEENEIQAALEIVGYRISLYQVREMITENDVHQRDGRLDFVEFKRVNLSGSLKFT